MSRPNALRPLRSLCALALAAMAVSAPSALAHLEVATGLTPFFDADGELAGAWTTWGTVRLEDGAWLRTCEEAAGSPFYSFGAELTDGRVMIGSFRGLVITEDACSFDVEPAALEGLSITAWARIGEPGAEELLLLTSSQGGEANLYRGPESTLALEPTALSLVGTLLFDLVASPDGSTLYVAGLDTASQQARLLMSEDGGDSFSTVAADLGERITVRALGLNDDGRLLVATRSAGEVFALETLSPDGTSFELVATFPTLPTSVAVAGGHEYVALQDGELFSRASADAAFARVEDAPLLICVTPSPDGESLYACARETDAEHHFYRTTDGVSFEGLIPFAEVEERLCPEGTPGRSFCTAYLPPEDAGVPGHDGGHPTADAGVSDGPDGGDPVEDPGLCRCTRSGGTGAGGAVLALLGLVLRPVRRRHRRAPQ